MMNAVKQQQRRKEQELEKDIKTLQHCVKIIADDEIKGALDRVLLHLSPHHEEAHKKRKITIMMDLGKEQEETDLFSKIMKRGLGKYPVLMTDGDILSLHELITNVWFKQQTSDNNNDDPTAAAAVFETDHTKLESSLISRFQHHHNTTTTTTSNTGLIIRLQYHHYYYNPDNNKNNEWKNINYIQSLGILRGIAICCKRPGMVSVALDADTSIQVYGSVNAQNAQKMNVTIMTVYFPPQSASNNKTNNTNNNNDEIQRNASIFSFADTQFIQCCFGRFAVFQASLCLRGHNNDVEKSKPKKEQQEEQEDDDDECTICFSQKANTILTGCGHMFCNECIRSYGKTQCPTCAIPFFYFNENEV